MSSLRNGSSNGRQRSTQQRDTDVCCGILGVVRFDRGSWDSRSAWCEAWCRARKACQRSPLMFTYRNSHHVAICSRILLSARSASPASMASAIARCSLPARTASSC
jgi:hypothetical protein